jgi:hypothetical protein
VNFVFGHSLDPNPDTENFKNEIGGVTITETDFFLFHSHVLAQISHYQVIHEEYTNDDRLHLRTTVLIQNFD